MKTEYTIDEVVEEVSNWTYRCTIAKLARGVAITVGAVGALLVIGAVGTSDMYTIYHVTPEYTDAQLLGQMILGSGLVALSIMVCKPLGKYIRQCLKTINFFKELQ